MRSSVKLSILFALLAALTLTGVADAHKLKASRAAKANRTFAGLLCKGSNDEETRCVASKSGGCRRISAHRMRCALFITLESREDKSRVRCRALMEWVIRKRRKGMQPVFLGIKSCKQTRAPESEGEPEQEPVPAP